jgi:hypothetical protein
MRWDLVFWRMGFRGSKARICLPRHAEARLDLREQRRVALQHGAPGVDPPGPDAGRDILLKRLLEGAALPPVEGEHAMILLHPAKRRADHVLRDAGAGCFVRKILDEGVEIAAAAGGVGGLTDEENPRQTGQPKPPHAKSSFPK